MKHPLTPLLIVASVSIVVTVGTAFATGNPSAVMTSAIVSVSIFCIVLVVYASR